MSYDFPATRSEITRRQLEKLSRLLGAVEVSNPFWQPRLAAAGWSAGRVALLEPTEASLRGLLDQLPIVRKAELAADQALHPPYGSNLTFPVASYSRLHQTSGTTTGQPMRWLDTPESWGWMMSCWRQIYALMGLRPDDRLAFPFSFGPFLGFWAGFEGAAQLGNLCIAAGGMSSEARLKLLADNQVTILACTPTYALRLVEVARQQRIDLRESSVRAILVAGEPGGNIPATRELMESSWNARVFDHWGMTEIGPLASETRGDPGSLAMLETECIAEVIDPSTNQPVAEGGQGELVITNLGRTGSPQLRYGTGDIVSPCWREVAGEPPFLRLPGGVLGRTDDMWIIRGNNVFPSSLEAIIRSSAEVAEYQLVVEAHRQMREITIRLECHADVAPAARQTCAESIRKTIKERHHFEARVELVEAGTLPRHEMKAKRIVMLGG
ncbi:MAG: CoF synthetase [Planctomyces sp.]|nr:CoF synthetase [Planctomyces sp.]